MQKRVLKGYDSINSRSVLLKKIPIFRVYVWSICEEVETLEQDEAAETFEQVDNLDEDFVAGTDVEIENSLDEQVETVEAVDGAGTVDH